jgi:predicted ATPase
MITNLILGYFKCFERLNLPLGKLTLLTGVNAAGKSSIIQSILLLHQTMIQNEYGTELLLNGDCVNLGSASDVIDEITGKNRLVIGLSDKKAKIEWVFSTQVRSKVTIELEKILYTDLHTSKQKEIYRIFPKTSLKNLIPFNSKQFPLLDSIANMIFNVKYLSAERVGPREIYQLNSGISRKNVGIRGEYTPWFLHENQDDAISSVLMVKNYPPTLIRQTEGWLNVFFPETSFQIIQIKSSNMVSLGIKTSKALEFHRPQNVGFGITQVFPIIVACLASKAGDLLLIENPESHLHPSGQSLMGEFLAKCASSDVQVIVESHSDHILNGIRKSVKNKIITPSSTIIHFFNKRDDENKFPQVISPRINEKGNLDQWPKGFFDQSEKDMEYFLGLES